MSSSSVSVPTLLLSIQTLHKANKLDDSSASRLKNATLAKNPQVLSLGEYISNDDEFVKHANEILSTLPDDKDSDDHEDGEKDDEVQPPKEEKGNENSSGSEKKTTGRSKLRGGLAITTSTTTTAKDNEQEEEESQANALLKAKRDRAAKRQSMPTKNLPDSVTAQLKKK